jgi:hypothetical protein
LGLVTLFLIHKKPIVIHQLSYGRERTPFVGVLPASDTIFSFIRFELLSESKFSTIEMQNYGQEDRESISLLERLPTEVLSEIIDLYIFDTGDIAGITHICNRIRQVAFGMITIWNDILILTIEDPLGAEYRYEQVTTRFNRGYMLY